MYQGQEKSESNEDHVIEKWVTFLVQHREIKNDSI
jgi:hypothetical protein